MDVVRVMTQVCLIVSDSGGVQEEARGLGLGVLVIRATTERPEAIEAGTARLVGTERRDIVSAVSRLLDDPAEYDRMSHAVNPYGDGHAAGRTVDAIRYFFGLAAAAPLPFQSGPSGQSKVQSPKSKVLKL